MSPIRMGRASVKAVSAAELGTRTTELSMALVSGADELDPPHVQGARLSFRAREEATVKQSLRLRLISRFGECKRELEDHQRRHAIRRRKAAKGCDTLARCRSGGAEHTVERQVDLDILWIGARTFFQDTPCLCHVRLPPEARGQQREGEVAMQRWDWRVRSSDLLPLPYRGIDKSAGQVEGAKKETRGGIVSVRPHRSPEYAVRRSTVREHVRRRQGSGLAIIAVRAAACLPAQVRTVIRNER